MRERLIDLIGECCGKYLNITNLLEFEKMIIADYLLDNGVVVMPCKVGTKVYFVHEICDENGDEVLYIDTGKIICFSLQGTGLWMYCRYKTGLTYWHKVDSEFGTEVFLTREEAEAKLKEGKSDGT